MLAREPAMARGIYEELSRPRVNVDKLMLEADEANKAIRILKDFSIVPEAYNLSDRDPHVWPLANSRMKASLQKVIVPQPGQHLS